MPMSLKYMLKTKPKTPLIVDQDLAFLDQLKSDPLANAVGALFAKNGKEAQLILANPDLEIAGIFVNFSLSDGTTDLDCTAVTRFARSHQATTPVYALLDPGIKVEQSDLDKKGIRSALQKPITLSSLVELVAPHAVAFNGAAASEKSKKDLLDVELSGADSEFVPIIATNFIAGAVSHFSVYVRMATGRFLKVVNAGDAFDPERVQNYLKKGVEFFYLRKEDHEQYVKFNSHISRKVVLENKLPVSFQSTRVMNYGEETFKYLLNQGLNENRLVHAIGFVDNMNSVVMKLSDQVDIMSDLIKDIERYQHGVALTMVASLIAKELGIETASALQTVGLAGLLHDIGLAGALPGMEHLEVQAMSAEQKLIYYAHPRKAAEKLRTVSGIHESMVQAVLHHHERKGSKTAFDPSQDRPKGINGVAEIVGISDEYLHLVYKSKKDPALDIKQELQKVVFRGFSNDTVEAFSRALYPNRSSRPKKIA